MGETTSEINIKTIYNNLDPETRTFIIAMVHSRESGQNLDGVVAVVSDLRLARERVEEKIKKLRKMGLVEQGKLVRTGQTKFPQFEIDPEGDRFRLSLDVSHFIFESVLKMDEPPDLFGGRH